MRVIVYQDYLRSGGTESQSIFLAEMFKKKGDDVLFVTNRPRGELRNKLEGANVKDISLQRRDYRLNWFCPDLKKTIQKFNPDVVFLMGRNANMQGWRMIKSFPDTKFIASFRTGRKIPDWYRKTIQAAPLTICNSEAAVERMNNLHLETSRVEVHPNPCLKTTFSAKRSDDSIFAQEDFEPSVRLLYTAACVPGKNHFGALRIIERLLNDNPKLTVYFVGSGPLFRKIKKEVHVRNLGKNICMTGFRRDVSLFYRSCDIAISPSLEESMPNALVESQYMGLPVVAYDEAGVKECFENNSSGLLVERNDENSFVEAVQSLIVNHDLRQRMSENAKKYAKAKFDPEKRFEILYDSVLRLANL